MLYLHTSTLNAVTIQEDKEARGNLTFFIPSFWFLLLTEMYLLS